MRTHKPYGYLVLVLSIAAGLLYNSWPIGYWLNPAVSKSSLASGLEAVGQPYNWLFIGGDVLSSLLMITVCWMLWNRFKSNESAKLIRISLYCIAIFGIGTIVDALIPERCVPELQTCPSFTHDPTLLIHGIFSIAASLFLFASLCILWFHRRHNLVLNGMLFGYILFGLVSLVEAIVPGSNGNWSQHYYITLCSVWLVLIPFSIYLATLEPPKNK